MKRIVAGIVLLTNIVGPAWADQCGTAGHTADMSSSQITTLLTPGSGLYACYRSGRYSYRDNNETLLSNGHVQEWHNGGSTIEDEGTYTITSLSGGGAIRYTYTSGGTFTYRVCTDTSSGPPYTYPVTANFLNNSTNAVLTIHVTSGAGTC